MTLINISLSFISCEVVHSSCGTAKTNLTNMTTINGKVSLKSFNVATFLDHEFKHKIYMIKLKET